MKPSSILFGVAAALSTVPSVSAATTTTSALSNNPTTEPVIGQITDQGCFNSSLGLERISENLDFNSDGKCGETCRDKGYDVAATTGGQECWCGNEYPPKENIVDNSECNISCTGFKDIPCGGLDTFSVYNTGSKLAVHYHDPVSSTSSSSGSSPSQTSSSPATSSSSGGSSEGSGNSKTIGIVVGVVVAVLIIAGAVGGVLYYLRKKRNQEIEEEHRRNAAVNAFINGSNAPDSSHGSISMTDSRLDPIMTHRRLSDGSIADNQDYSRKILRVTNA